MTLSAQTRRDWLRLARAETVGPVAFQHLIARYGDPSAALDALPDLARRGGRATVLRIPSAAEADAELAAGERLGALLLCASESAYPQALAALDPPPPVLWAIGRADLLHRPAAAIVGARVASAAGQRFARSLAVDLGAAGLVVVSGLARGIDAAAHEGGMSGGTVAVLGGGPDDVYPPEHRDLYRRIAEAGCVVAEHPPGHRAQARDFPRRNRIISGLARAVVVVEAEARSGSLITARLAAEQGREVLAVPGSPLDPRAKGTNDLIRQGAYLCEGAEDVLRAIARPGGVAEPDRPFSVPLDVETPADGLHAQLRARLSPTPVSRDELARSLGAPVGQVAAALIELSLAGEAELLPGGLAATP